MDIKYQLKDMPGFTTSTMSPVLQMFAQGWYESPKGGSATSS